MEVTLDRLLDSRDRRHERQSQLLDAHPGLTLVCLTVVMPGPVKRDSRSLVVACAALTAILEQFTSTIAHLEAHDRDTGYEAYLLTTLPPETAKRHACRIEDTHPLGRLMDIDVIMADGTPMPRSSVQQPQRRCLLCEREARHCMRARTHSLGQLQAHISQMINDYVG